MQYNDQHNRRRMMSEAKNEASELIPLLDPTEKDERFEGVVLLEASGAGKITAEDCGDHWFIRTWDTTKGPDDVLFLYSDFGYTMYKEHAKRLLGV